MLSDPEEFRKKINKAKLDYSKSMTNLIEKSESKDKIQHVFKKFKQIEEYVRKALLYLRKQKIDIIESAKIHNTEVIIQEEQIKKKCDNYEKFRQDFDSIPTDLNKTSINPNKTPIESMKSNDPTKICEAFMKFKNIIELKEELGSYPTSNMTSRKIRSLESNVNR